MEKKQKTEAETVRQQAAREALSLRLRFVLAQPTASDCLGTSPCLLLFLHSVSNFNPPHSIPSSILLKHNQDPPDPVQIDAKQLLQTNNS